VNTNSYGVQLLGHPTQCMHKTQKHLFFEMNSAFIALQSVRQTIHLIMAEGNQNRRAAQAWTGLTQMTIKGLVCLTLIHLKILFFCGLKDDAVSISDHTVPLAGCLMKWEGLRRKYSWSNPWKYLSYQRKTYNKTLNSKSLHLFNTVTP